MSSHSLPASEIPKLFVSPDAQRLDSVRLAMKVLASDWIPTHMVALWRGGAAIATYMHEVFQFHGHKVDHIAIRTSRTTGINQFAPTVEVHNLGYLVERLSPTDKLLIVDDVDESGLSAEAVFGRLSVKCRFNMPKETRLAVLYDKPTKHKTLRVPDYFMHITDIWVVMPHELEGLRRDEIDPLVLAILDGDKATEEKLLCGESV